MTSFMALDGVTSFLRLKGVTITCKHMRRSLSIGGSSSVQWRKVGRSWILQMCFRRLLRVRIKIDQLQCVNCWVIIHCLSVSCTKINHSRCTLVIWSSLQLTSKQWIIKQQFTAGADLFLKLTSFLCFTYIFTSNASKKWNGICDKQIITWGFVYRPQYQPSTIINPQAKALGLIMGSRVDTLVIIKTPWDNL